MPARSEWMLYGAHGRTGRLVLDEALRRGHKPVLAGRDGAKLTALARTTGLATRPVSLDDGAEMCAALSDVRCVLLDAFRGESSVPTFEQDPFVDREPVVEDAIPFPVEHSPTFLDPLRWPIPKGGRSATARQKSSARTRGPS